jgi:high-affinity iron transporter
MFLIGLREGLEATLVVCILIAYLVKTGNKDRLAPVWTGVGAAVGLALAVGAVLTFGSSQLTFRAQEAFGGIMSVIAVGLVTWMIFWMRKAGASMRTELHGRLDQALSIGTGALVATAFVAVAREGLETALFVWPAVQATPNSAAPLTGVILGLAAAALLGYLLYRRAISFNIAKFFRWTGVVLVVVAAGVLAYGIAELQEIGWLPGEEAVAFDISATVGPETLAGALLRGILNIHPVTTWLQAVAWLLYLVPVMYLFLRAPRPSTAVGTRQEATAPATTR